MGVMGLIIIQTAVVVGKAKREASRTDSRSTSTSYEPTANTWSSMTMAILDVVRLTMILMTMTTVIGRMRMKVITGVKTTATGLCMSLTKVVGGLWAARVVTRWTEGATGLPKVGERVTSTVTTLEATGLARATGLAHKMKMTSKTSLDTTQETCSNRMAARLVRSGLTSPGIQIAAGLTSSVETNLQATGTTGIGGTKRIGQRMRRRSGMKMRRRKRNGGTKKRKRIGILLLLHRSTSTTLLFHHRLRGLVT
jgi:hypothetical protein